MPTIRERFGDAFLRQRGHTATISAVTDLSPRVRLVRLTDPALSGLRWTPGAKLKLQTSDSTLRSYTVSRLDRRAGWIETIGICHGNGPGSAWFQNAHPGQRAFFLGPKDSLTVAPAAPWHLMLGDETTIGLFLRFQGTLPEDAPVFGAIEINEVDAPALDAAGLRLSAALRDPADRGGALLRWLEGTPLPSQPGAVYLSGHTETATRLHAALLARGVPADTIHAKPYWSTAPRKRRH